MQYQHDSSLALPAPLVASILAQHGEDCSEHRIGYYPDISALAEMVRSSKHWTMGEIFVFAESPERFLIMKQIAPSSCEMLTITVNGIQDVLTAYRFPQEELAQDLQGYLDQAAHSSVN